MEKYINDILIFNLNEDILSNEDIDIINEINLMRK